MTRGEMRTLVRTRIRDDKSTTWTDVQVDSELNVSAREVARLLSRFQNVNYTYGTESFTTVGNTTAYALSATDIRRIWRVRRTDSTPDQPAQQINELDQLDINSNLWGGFWRYYLTRNPTTKAWTINFPHYQVAAGMIFEVIYIARPVEIATGTVNDGSSYTMIDEDFHDLIVWHCATSLLGQDSSLGQIAAAKFADLRDQLVRDAEATTSPAMIQQEWY